MTTAWFVTDQNVLVPAVTADQMREVDRVAIEEIGPNLHQMMENAGRNLAATAMERLGPEWATTPIVVLAGTGGNGGGGICAARHLANRGADVTVVVSEPASLAPVPADQLRTYRGTGGRLEPPGSLGELTPGLVVDAVIGYSLRRGPLRGKARVMIEWIARQAAPVVALDVPSGVDATSGATVSPHVRADATLTLALPKMGLDVPAAGRVFLADIGIPFEVYRSVGLTVPAGVFGSRYRIPLRVAPT
jgi:NAD(P)H-hydrate epimerase